MKALLIPEDSSAAAVDVQDLKDLQGFVGGYIEPVTAPGAPLTVYVNEDGLSMNLTYNALASRFCGRSIVGPALILGPPDDEGDDTPAPASIIKAYTS